MVSLPHPCYIFILKRIPQCQSIIVPARWPKSSPAHGESPTLPALFLRCPSETYADPKLPSSTLCGLTYRNITLYIKTMCNVLHGNDCNGRFSEILSNFLGMSYSFYPSSWALNRWIIPTIRAPWLWLCPPWTPSSCVCVVLQARNSDASQLPCSLHRMMKKYNQNTTDTLSWAWAFGSRSEYQYVISVPMFCECADRVIVVGLLILFLPWKHLEYFCANEKTGRYFSEHPLEASYGKSTASLCHLLLIYCSSAAWFYPIPSCEDH